jgi:hypothetical protein
MDQDCDLTILDFRFWIGELRRLKALIPRFKIAEALIQNPKSDYPSLPMASTGQAPSASSHNSRSSSVAGCLKTYE